MGLTTRIKGLRFIPQPLFSWLISCCSLKTLVSPHLPNCFYDEVRYSRHTKSTWELGGRGMVRASLYFLFVILCTAITVSGADVPAGGDPLQYRVVSVPSTNKKRIDAMCIRYLSVIPKAKLVPKTSETTVYRLIANAYDSLAAAKKRTAELRPYGESPFVMSTSQGYSVVVGSQLTKELAVAEQKRLARKNIATTVLELQVPLKEWQMRSEQSFNLRYAVSVASKLAELGVTTTLEPE